MDHTTQPADAENIEDNPTIDLLGQDFTLEQLKALVIVGRMLVAAKYYANALEQEEVGVALLKASYDLARDAQTEDFLADPSGYIVVGVMSAGGEAVH